MLISYLPKTKTRFNCCTVHYGCTAKSEIRPTCPPSMSRIPRHVPFYFLVTHSETCTLLLPCHAFRDMYPFTSLSRIPRHVPFYFLVTHSETCTLLLPCHAFRDMYPFTSLSRIPRHVPCTSLSRIPRHVPCTSLSRNRRYLPSAFEIQIFKAEFTFAL